MPFWTKRSPDYGTVMKTINARDDSLADNRGMWTSMKKKKRCIVIAQGFYEWQKKNGGREKIPHFVKRTDDKLMCFAGLWDCVKYEGRGSSTFYSAGMLISSDSDEKHFTYTIITTDNSKQLSFLHDRMPVILENGSADMWTWLDPKRIEWTQELQSLLKPFSSQLECYPVNKEVGKVGNNSADFIVPVSSTQNKKNIANFFANAKKPGAKTETGSPARSQSKSKAPMESREKSLETPTASQEQNGESGSASQTAVDNDKLKRKREDDTPALSPQKAQKIDVKTSSPSESPLKATRSPEKSATQKKLRSATSNGTASKGSPVKSDGSQKITSFFGK